MKKANKESIALARHIHSFLAEYVPFQKSQSEHTLRSYEYAISLFVGFLEKRRASARRNCVVTILTGAQLRNGYGGLPKNAAAPRKPATTGLRP